MDFETELREIDASRRLGALSRRDSLVLVAAKPPTWRVRGILTSDDYGTLAGAKGVGKTLANCDLAVSVALGVPWFGRFETERARVLLLSAEDSRARLWRRLDAIARSRGRDPEELEGWVFVHPLAFPVAESLPLLEGELDALEPGLVSMDPAYRYLAGTRAQLFDMGAVLTPLQQACAERGATLLVGHHFNRRQDASREERLSGAGLLEWSRVLITMEAPPPRDGVTVVTFEVSGNSIEPITFRVRRRVVALDDGPDPEIAYEAEVVAEGAEAVAARYATAAERILAVLPDRPEDALTIREIGDRLATDGRPLKADTIHKVLRRELADQVDCINPGRGTEGRWWRA